MTKDEMDRAFEVAKDVVDGKDIETLWWDDSIGMLVSRALLHAVKQYNEDMDVVMKRLERALEEIKND
jgi:hypothetical protein